jgi:hypothetical protein
VEVQGESFTVTPPKVDVDAVTREEFERLSKEVAGKVDKVEGKGLSTNDFTDEYKQKVDETFERQGTDNNYTDADKELVQTIPDKVGQDEFNETVTGLGEAINDVGTVLAETKAAKDGYYPDMSVSMADNLVGRGDVQDAQINFRPSAGADNITDGAARIKKIKGNSVVWNQQLPLGLVQVDFDNTEGSTVLIKNFAGVGREMSIKANHIYYACANANVDNRNIFVQIANINKATINIMDGAIITAPFDRDGYFIIKVPAGQSVNGTVHPQVIDLTQMFGAGNEPTTYEEYLQRKPMNIADEFAYNEGTIVDMKVDSLISTSDNAYDYTKGYARVMGGQTYDCSYGTAFVEKVYFSTNKNNIVAEENAMTSENGKYIFPSDGYVVPYTTDGDKREYCVCLQHSYTKPHPPYQQDVKDLSFIGEAFSGGMRSAGSVFDEIRFNPTKNVWEKVERVGVRAYAEGDAEDSSVTTDGKTTNYPLENPTPTTIDLSPNFNLDYLVWDFGAEEAIASVPSAPFRADINYEPNSVDDLRWAVSEIRNLKAQIAQMQASVTNLTE